MVEWLKPSSLEIPPTNAKKWDLLGLWNNINDEIVGHIFIYCSENAEPAGVGRLMLVTIDADKANSVCLVSMTAWNGLCWSALISSFPWRTGYSCNFIDDSQQLVYSPLEWLATHSISRCDLYRGWLWLLINRTPRQPWRHLYTTLVVNTDCCWLQDCMYTNPLADWQELFIIMDHVCPIINLVLHHLSALLRNFKHLGD